MKTLLLLAAFVAPLAPYALYAPYAPYAPQAPQAPSAPQAPQAPQAPLPGTDIYLVPLAGGLSSMKTSKPVAVSAAPGYDNQPSFSADGHRILFAANRDGKQTDVYVFDRRTKRVTQLTRTAENENSPTYLPPGVGDADGFSVVQTEPDRTQRLWRFNAQGANPQLVLSEIKPVGYHAWIDPEHLVLFVLGQPATLQIANVKTGKAEVAADNIGRSLHRIPGSRLASFVQRDPSGEYWIKQIDTITRNTTPLVKVVEGSSDRDYAWMPDGKTILMTAGTRVFSWTPGSSGWVEVFDGASHQLGAITRLSVSPTGDAVAIVVAEPKK
jgi:dipeptidyl aminopeptidase/acylaminoacyl peptidase